MQLNLQRRELVATGSGCRCRSGSSYCSRTSHRRGEVCTREELFSDVWGIGFDPGTNVVDVYVRRLRSKFAANSSKRCAMWAIDSSRAKWSLAAAWAVFATVNAWLMVQLPGEETIPYHLIWASYALLYGLFAWSTWLTWIPSAPSRW